MSFKKSTYKRLGIKRETVAGQIILDAPSVGGLRAVCEIPFVKPIKADTETVLTLDDIHFEYTLGADTRKLVVKNASGSARSTYELRLVERGLPLSYGGWTSTDKPMDEIFDDVLKSAGIMPKKRKPSKAKKRKE